MSDEEQARFRAPDHCVNDIPLSKARELVELYHYSRGGSNTRVYTHGLFRRDDLDKCLGCAWWIPPTRTAAESVSKDWQSVLSLTRFVIVPGVPTNAASFLLAASMRMIERLGKWATLLTYADEGEGHTGGIYRATNWEYMGIRPGDPRYIDPESGRHVARKAGGKTRTNAEMVGLGYVNTGRTRKHKFIKKIRQGETP